MSPNSNSETVAPLGNLRKADTVDLLTALITERLPEYLNLAEPDSAAHMLLGQLEFPNLDRSIEPLQGLGIVAHAPVRHGDAVTVLIQVEAEPTDPPETAHRLGSYFVAMEARFNQPVLLSVLYLKGARPGINIQSSMALHHLVWVT